MQNLTSIFYHAANVLDIKDVRFRVMQRRGPIGKVRSLRLAHINLKTRAVTIDVLTPKERRPKKVAALLRVVAHELTHLQKPPYRQWFRGRWITRAHYPAFYRQVNRNVERLKKDALLSQYFT